MRKTMTKSIALLLVVMLMTMLVPFGALAEYTDPDVAADEGITEMVVAETEVVLTEASAAAEPIKVSVPGYFHRNPLPKLGAGFLELEVEITADGRVYGIKMVSEIADEGTAQLNFGTAADPDVRNGNDSSIIRNGPMPNTGGVAGTARTGNPWLAILEYRTPDSSCLYATWWEHNFIGRNLAEAQAIPLLAASPYASAAFKDAIVLALQRHNNIEPVVSTLFPGSGTAESPFLISTPTHLLSLAVAINRPSSSRITPEQTITASFYSTAHYRLTADINLGGISNWTPIGNAGTNAHTAHRFSGVFDGNGHTISNMRINAVDPAVVSPNNHAGIGLFGVIGINAEFKDLHLENINIDLDLQLHTAPHNAAFGVGALFGSSLNGGANSLNASVDNVSATGRINVANTSPVPDNTNSNLMVGGLIGCMASTGGSVTNSWANVDVNVRNVHGAAIVGGLIAVTGHAGSHVNYNMAFFGANLAAFGDVYSYGGPHGKAQVGGVAGGLVGTANGVFYNVLATGDVEGNSFQTGLIFGRAIRAGGTRMFYNSDAELVRIPPPDPEIGDLPKTVAWNLTPGGHFGEPQGKTTAELGANTFANEFNNGMVPADLPALAAFLPSIPDANSLPVGGPPAGGNNHFILRTDRDDDFSHTQAVPAFIARVGRAGNPWINILPEWAGMTNAAVAAVFSDIAVNRWYTSPVAWAYANDITTGMPAGSNTFRPNRTLDRAMFVTFLWRIAGMPAPDGALAAFPDRAAVPAWARAAVNWAGSANVRIARGFDADGTFRPGADVTRQEMAIFLERFVGVMGLDTGSSAGAIPGRYVDRDLVISWAYRSVAWAVANDIMGVDTVRLNPTETATRAQAVTMLHRVVNEFDIAAPR